MGLGSGGKWDLKTGLENDTGQEKTKQKNKQEQNKRNRI